MSTATTIAEQRILLGNVSWSLYVALADSADNPRGRLAYDQGVLEIMSPSSGHEYAKKLIGRFVEIYTLEKEIEVRSASATTFKRADLRKGVEADECYYIQSVDAIRGAEEIDLLIHPPPDLVIEVDITRSSKMKQGIYAALRVAEVWRFDGDMLRVLLRQDSEYVEAGDSRVLPGFPMDAARRLLTQRHVVGETTLVRQFQHLVQVKA